MLRSRPTEAVVGEEPRRYRFRYFAERRAERLNTLRIGLTSGIYTYEWRVVEEGSRYRVKAFQNLPA